jgi:hypothetical protein
MREAPMGLSPLIGQLGRRKAAATLLEAAEFLILVGRDENSR